MKNIRGLFLIHALLFLFACGGGGGSAVVDPPVDPTVKGVLINEVLSANASGVMAGFYNNNCTEWIEIINTGDAAVDISGYSLTDDQSKPDKWIIPDANVLSPGETVLFWADKLNVYDHTNFKLKMAGGTLAIYSPTQMLVDSVVYPAQTTDVSYGRGPGGGSVWYYFAIPTPNAPNSGVKAVTFGRTAAPEFSSAAGFKDSPISVTITAEPGANIRYTTDGSIPSVDSPLYESSLPISATTVLKARAFSSTAMPSPVTTATYFFGESTTLPIVSVSTNPAYLWSDASGIYVKGPNAEADPPYYGANFREDWERPAHVEFFENDGTVAFAQFSGLKINGNTTQGVPEKSLSFSAKEKYGTTTFAYALFPEDKPSISNFPRFLVRNSGQDWALTLFRDAFTARVIKGQMDLDYQAYRPVIHFLNGEYNGVINLREKADQYFAVSNAGATAGKVDFLEHEGTDIVVDDGSATHYTALIDYLTANDPTLPGTYATVQTMMDVDEYMNYVIAETFCGNFDWPASNVKLWRKQATGEKWRWILQDTDFAWGYKSEINSAYGYDLDIFHYALDPIGNAWPNPPEGTFLLRSLMQNAAFRAEFRSRYLTHLATTFETTRLLGIVDGLKATLEPEMQRQIDKWGGQFCGMVDSTYNYPGSLDEWRAHVALLRAYVQNRTAAVLAQVNHHFPEDGSLVVD